MKKRKIIIVILVVVAVILACGAYLAMRLKRRGTDIIGVTTQAEKNVVIMNSASGNEFESGRGNITVGEDEHVVLTWELKSGSFDIKFSEPEALEDSASASLDELETEASAEYVQETNAVEGSGKETYDLGSGDYTVSFIMHGAVGTATVSVEKK